MNKKIHTITHPNGDTLSFIDYGVHGVTVKLTQDGEWYDFGFGPDEIPSLMAWLMETAVGGPIKVQGTL